LRKIVITYRKTAEGFPEFTLIIALFILKSTHFLKKLFIFSKEKSGLFSGKKISCLRNGKSREN